MFPPNCHANYEALFKMSQRKKKQVKKMRIRSVSMYWFGVNQAGYAKCKFVSSWRYAWLKQTGSRGCKHRLHISEKMERFSEICCYWTSCNCSLMSTRIGERNAIRMHVDNRSVIWSVMHNWSVMRGKYSPCRNLFGKCISISPLAH